ncbi:endonuclease V [Desulfoferrobacter suflitae]|uniref:endonuclease V n=1 Tax=Desulfoferrobacter suflitae TaxID=2865782 RepID=UPI002164A118|nr:endonuclease V [Desulfoferrobacter suflitae]MCK8602113.1 endonuclease V [Desulfoferrobacter suflitae]
MPPREAVKLQRILAEQVELRRIAEDFAVLGASDISYMKPVDRLVAVVLTFHWPSLEPLESVHAVSPIGFPYVPGLLSFREIPPLLMAYRLLKRAPDVFLCDGQGIAHPRRLGLASHLGLCLDIPTIGCAKSRLCGEHRPLELRRGNYAPLLLNDVQVGYVFCSRNGVKPIYISPGHLADLDSSRKLIERCLGRFRIPQPLRQAHLEATRIRKSLFAGSG